MRTPRKGVDDVDLTGPLCASQCLNKGAGTGGSGLAAGRLPVEGAECPVSGYKKPKVLDSAGLWSMAAHVRTDEGGVAQRRIYPPFVRVV